MDRSINGAIDIEFRRQSFLDLIAHSAEVEKLAQKSLEKTILESMPRPHTPPEPQATAPVPAPAPHQALLEAAAQRRQTISNTRIVATLEMRKKQPLAAPKFKASQKEQAQFAPLAFPDIADSEIEAKPSTFFPVSPSHATSILRPKRQCK